jgi:hypothetical protein
MIVNFMRSGLDLVFSDGSSFVISLGLVELFKSLQPLVGISKEHTLFRKDLKHGALILCQRIVRITLFINQQIGNDLFLFLVLNIFKFLYEHLHHLFLLS